MKILYYFQELDTPMYQWQRQHFLEELSHHDISIDTFNPLVYSNVNEANDKLLLKVKEGNYDLFMSNMGYYKMLHVSTLEEIKKSGVPTLRIAWDNLMAPYIDEVLASHFDLVWLTAQETQGIYDKWNVKAVFAPYAANPYKYTYHIPNSIKRNACFIGNPHGSRAIMINHLSENGIDVDLYHGKGVATRQQASKIPIKFKIINPPATETVFNRIRFPEGRKLIIGSLINKLKGQVSVIQNEHLHRAPGLSHEDMIKVYSSTALSLASSSAGHTDVLNNPLRIINLRNFEIPMCGGIQICRYSDELASYFEDNKEIVLYRTDEELVDKARYYTEKASDSEILRMKEAARKRSESDHTWWCRFSKVFDTLGIH